MNRKHAAPCLGILTLLAAAGSSLHASQIIINNVGGASDNSSYSNTYNSDSGYISSGNGTTTTTGTATGLFDVTLTGSATDPGGNFGRLSSASSTASANLGTGEIKIFQSTGPCYDTGPLTCGGGVNAAGTINENVIFHNDTGAPTVVSFFWHNNLEVTGDATRSSVGGSTVFAAFSGGLAWDFANCTASISNCSFLDGSRTGGWNSMSMTPAGNFGEDFVLTYVIDAGDTGTRIFENFNVVCQQGATCDGTHTASLALGLAAGVTFTSESGIFLTQAASDTPEPGTWAMLSSAGLLLGFTRLRFRRQG